MQKQCKNYKKHNLVYLHKKRNEKEKLVVNINSLCLVVVVEVVVPQGSKIYVAASKPPRGLMRGGVSALQCSEVVVLIMLVVLNILVLSLIFCCDWGFPCSFEHPYHRKCNIFINFLKFSELVFFCDKFENLLV